MLVVDATLPFHCREAEDNCKGKMKRKAQKTTGNNMAAAFGHNGCLKTTLKNAGQSATQQQPPLMLLLHGKLLPQLETAKWN